MFTVYIQRDTYMNPFLTRTWTPAATHHGQALLGDISAAEMGTYNKLFLKHVASFLLNPFFKEHIVHRTTDINSVWDLFKKIYNFDKCVETFLDISNLTYKSTESYFTFYHRILYLIEQNLAPAGTIVKLTNFETRFWTRDRCHVGSEDTMGKPLSSHVSSLGVPMKKKFHPDFFNKFL